jgi:hypothetical protein
VEVHHDIFRDIGSLGDALFPLGRDLFDRTSLAGIREDVVKAFVVWVPCATSRNTDLSG